MIYVTRGKNDTGQNLVSCPHLADRGGIINQWLYPDGSAVYEVLNPPIGLYFRPSHRSIVLWCQKCFEKFGPLEEEKEKVGGTN